MSYSFPIIVVEDSKILKNSLDYSKMSVNAEGLYSTMLPIHANQEISMITESVITEDKPFSMLDTTANVGSGSLTIANYFKDAMVTSLEINSDTFDIMCANIQTLGVQNITPINIDCFDYIENLSPPGDKFSMVYCDPPWGGPKEYSKGVLYTNLYLEHNKKQVSVIELIKLVFDKQISDIFVLKTPPEFAVGTILDQLNTYFDTVKITAKCTPVINKKGNIDYHLYMFSCSVVTIVPCDRIAADVGQAPESPSSGRVSFSSKFYINRNNNRLISLIRKFLSKHYRNVPRYIIDGAINYMIRSTSGDVTDADIFMTLASRLCKYQKVHAAPSATGRAMSRINDIKEYIAPYIGCKQYLDIGCSEGSLTQPIGMFLKVDPKNIHGCDLGADTGVDRGFVYSQASVEDLPYKDGQFQFVSLIMSLHHFPDPKKALKEVRRVLAPGGILLIREHNCKTDEFSTFLDFIHYMYAVVIGREVILRKGHEQEDLESGEGRIIATYRSKYNWNIEISSADFLKIVYIHPKHADMFRSYYAIYRKIGGD